MAEKKKEKLDYVLEKLHEHDSKFEKIDNRFDEVMGGLDKVIGELEKAREDRVFAVAKDREQDRRLDGLDVRVKKLEVV